MAKKKTSDAPVSVGRPAPTLHLDATEKQLKGVELGEEVTVTAKGKITGARLPDSWDKENDYPGSITIEYTNLKVMQGENEFSLLAED